MSARGLYAAALIAMAGCSPAPGSQSEVLLSKDPINTEAVQRVERKLDSLRVVVDSLRAELRGAR